jgi:hypothetical protein
VGRRLVAWSLWLATVGNLVAGLVVALALVRPLPLAVVADWAAGVVFLLSLATIGLVLTLRRRPIPSAGTRCCSPGTVDALRPSSSTHA